MTSPETLNQTDTAPSVIQLPDNLDPNKETQLQNKLEEYLGTEFDRSLGVMGLLRKLALGKRLAPINYKCIILDYLLLHRSLDLVDLRKTMEGSDFGFEIDQVLWAEAATEIRDLVDSVLK